MGFGKALGGILSDAYGIRKVATLSTLFSLPFLLVGDNLMIVSIIGIMLFSMTMAITLAILVSKLKNTPGLAFGFTTIGLFLGFVQIFFWKLSFFRKFLQLDFDIYIIPIYFLDIHKMYFFTSCDEKINRITPLS
jgi:hypothetical protein